MFVTGWCVIMGGIAFGPFKNDDDAFGLMLGLKEADPTADLHLWQMIGSEEQKVPSNG